MNKSNTKALLGEEGFEFIPTNALIPQMRISLALNQRKIYLIDDVTPNSIFECIYYFNRIADMDRRYGEKDSPIDFYINTDGGSAYDCLSLVSLIESFVDDGYNIRTINMGRAFSAGFILSIVGKERLAYKYSKYMFHDVASCLIGNSYKMQEDLTELLALRDTIAEIVMKHSEITMYDLDEIFSCKQDRFYNPLEGIELGFVDKIV